MFDSRIPTPDNAADATPGGASAERVPAAPVRRSGAGGLALRERVAARLREIALLDESVLLHDGDGVIIGCSPAAERLLRVAAADLVAIGTLSAGFDVFDRYGLPLAPRDLPAVRAIATGRTQAVALALRGGDGGVTWVDATAHPLTEEGADAPYAVLVSLRAAAAPEAS